MGNTFRKTVRNMNQKYQRQPNEATLSSNQKKRLFKQTKMYILVQEILESLEEHHLKHNETIRSFLPLTNDGANISFMTSGIMGLYHPKSKKAKKYVNDFHDLRGNRLFIFTSQRIIFMTIIEYLDQELFYTYPYDKIETITLKKNTLGYFDWEKGFPPARKKMYTYFFDFECDNAIFSELFSEMDGKIVLEQVNKIEEMKHIAVSEEVYRQRAFDALLNNPLFGYRVTKFISYGLILLFLTFLIGLFFGMGPFAVYLR
ncbi:hypothetical protein I6N96_06360 [Enterococcus sp. BWM-S5]|uniref:YokE-like PH domain-containing protein n=1 Tax=Enterococcus larvae TaxID=2794352 RepID=A0ABS4CHH9_9ENTE|nr:PH domain-containing protein [Enterococcus larvae]MBP1045898.1 hypothetical protein [Enterococcus larvae]